MGNHSVVIAVPCEPAAFSRVTAADSPKGSAGGGDRRPVRWVQDWMTDASAGGFLAAVDRTEAPSRSVVSFTKMDEQPDATNTTLPQFCMRGRAYMCGWSADIMGTKCLGPATSAIHQGFLLNVTDGSMRNSRCRSARWQCLRVPPSSSGAAG